MKRLGPINWGDPVVREHPLNQGRVAWWLAVPSFYGMTWRDLMGQNHGTLTNMTTAGTSGWGSTTRPGGFGEMRFDGTDDRIDFGIGKTPTGALPFTTLIWVNPGAFGVGNYGTSISWGLGVAASAVIFALDGSGGAGAMRFGRYGDDFIITSNKLTVNAWNHVALTYDGVSIVSYINSVADNTASRTLITGTSGMRIGDLVTVGTQPFIGKIDSASIYNRALSAAEILALYNEERTGYPTTLRRPSPAYSRLSTVIRRLLYKDASRSI